MRVCVKAVKSPWGEKISPWAKVLSPCAYVIGPLLIPQLGFNCKNAHTGAKIDEERLNTNDKAVNLAFTG